MSRNKDQRRKQRMFQTEEDDRLKYGRASIQPTKRRRKSKRKR